MNTWKVVNQVLVSVAAVVIIVTCIAVVCRKPVTKEMPVTKEVPVAKEESKTIPIDVINQWEKAKAAAVADATKQLREDYEKQIADLQAKQKAAEETAAKEKKRADESEVALTNYRNADLYTLGPDGFLWDQKNQPTQYEYIDPFFPKEVQYKKLRH